MPEKYRKFQLECGEMYEGRRSAYFFEWSPKFIVGESPNTMKTMLMDAAEGVIDRFIKELKNPPTQPTD